MSDDEDIKIVIRVELTENEFGGLTRKDYLLESRGFISEEMKDELWEDYMINYDQADTNSLNIAKKINRVKK